MKRIFKIAAGALLVFFAVGAGLVVFIRLKYPPERVKQILLGTLAQKYGITATCEQLAFSLFSGFVLDKLTLVEVQGQRAETPADFRSPLSIERINFSYRWRSLLARQLEIDEVEITRPFLRYWQAPDASTNLEAWLAAFTDSVAAVDSTAELPISINLKKFRLQDFNLRALMVSAADTQQFSLAHLDAELANIEVDRRSRYRGQFKLLAAPARVEYQAHARAAAPLRFTGWLPLQASGNMNNEALTANFEVSLAEGRGSLGAQETPLPVFNASGELQYHFLSSELQLSTLQLQLADAFELAGSFSLKTLPDTSCNVSVQRGHVDFERLTALLHARRDLAMLSDWQSWHGAGKLEIRDSFFRQNKNGTQYRVALAGEGLSLADSASRLGITGGDLDLRWETAPENATNRNSELTCRLHLAACGLPLEEQNVLATGPMDLRASFSLTPEYLPSQGDLDLTWQNFSGGKVRARSSFAPKNERGFSPKTFKTLLHLEADSLNLAPLSGQSMVGRLRRAVLRVEGESFDNLRLAGAIENDTLTYFTAESFGEIPPDDLQFSALLKTTAAFSHVAFSNGALQCQRARAVFQGFYDVGRSVLRFELPEAHAAIAEIMPLLPQDLAGDPAFPYLAGTALAQGWFESRMLPSGKFDYTGKLFARAKDGIYADTLSGVFAEKLDIESEWTLVTDSTLGEYRAQCPALRLDYLPAPLPPAEAEGKLVVYEDRFLIKEGRLEVPAWSVRGEYGVLGKFLPQGMQVRTTFDAGMKAPEKLILGKALALQGNLNMRFTLDQYLPDDAQAPQPAHLAGSLEVEHFNLTRDSSLALRDLNVHAEFAQDFDLLDLTLPPISERKPLALASAGEALLLHEVLGEAQREHHAAPSRLTLKELQLGNYQCRDISAELELGHGRVEVKQFRMNLFEGNLIGNVLVGLGDGNPDHLTYALSMQASSVDVSRLRRLGAQVEKGSKLSADLSLSGAGASVEKMEEVLAQLAGALNISKIEGKVASNLLQALDPKGTDVGVQRMRLLLKTGWNVKTMKFEIKNGFVYASVSLVKTKPWTALFNLPSKLDFARFPLKYFMQAEAE